MDKLFIGAILGCYFLFLPIIGIAQDSEGVTSSHERQSTEIGRRMYMDGILPSGDLMSAMIQNDIEVTGKQVRCGACHRRSGMGSTEGQQVVPAVTGKMLFKPLRLPASKPPETPILRLAYTRETLKRAIRNGIDANGKVLDPIMPRYPLDDDALDHLIGYLDTLSVDFSPGVDEHEIHFATIISDKTDAAKKKALLDVMREFIAQKNIETRHETERAEHAPWHKEWMFKPYRKWVLHEWDLKGSRETWPEQLDQLYKQNPVFAILSGVVPGNWYPIHQFCEENRIPCLFPTTDLPVISENDFYPMYMNRGMLLEGEGVASHIESEKFSEVNVVQIYETENEAAKTAADGLRAALKDKTELHVTDYALGMPAESQNVSLPLSGASVLVVWGDKKLLETQLSRIIDKENIQRIYLSTVLFGTDGKGVPDDIVDKLLFIHTQEMPSKLQKLILRSTGWLRAKRIYSPEEKRIQANAYFALKTAGSALRSMRGYFYRDYFIEKIENVIDNAPYTSVYPRISLAPGQRFVSKGYYIAKFSQNDTRRLESITKWITP